MPGKHRKTSENIGKHQYNLRQNSHNPKHDQTYKNDMKSLCQHFFFEYLWMPAIATTVTPTWWMDAFARKRCAKTFRALSRTSRRGFTRVHSGDQELPLQVCLNVWKLPGLVNVYITMENHHFQWENPLFLWSFSIAMLNYQRLIL